MEVMGKKQREAKQEMNRWHPSAMSSWQALGDPVADAVIQELLSRGQIDGLHSVLDAVQLNSDPIPECPPILKSYFETTEVLPDFANPDTLRYSQDIFSRYGLPMTLSLFCLVLPEGYAAPRPALALSFTRTMYDHTRRRLAETAQFLLDVVSPGAFEPEGRAIRSIQKVRLMHAAARFFVKRRPEWPASYGDPISQEDIAAVAGGFGSETIRGLEKLGIQLKEEEKEAYVHCWAVMSSMIGLQRELVARDFDDMDRCVQAYKRRQWGPSKEGKELTASLMEMVNRQLPPLLRGLPETYLYYLMGQEGAEILGVKRSRRSSLLRPFLGLNSFINMSQHRSRRLARIIRSLTLGILQGVMVREIGDKPVKFYMQPAIREAWQMAPIYRRFSRKGNLSAISVSVRKGKDDSKPGDRNRTESSQEVKLIDLSRTGAGLLVNPDCSIGTNGTSLLLEITRENVSIKVHAMICNERKESQSEMYQIGVEFDCPDPRTARIIQHWLDLEESQDLVQGTKAVANENRH